VLAWLAGWAGESYTACPDQPEAHRGACFYYELYPEYMTLPMEQVAFRRIPPDGVFKDLAFWPFDADWGVPLSAWPVRTGTV
jgi:hypothetical protein